MIVEALKTVVEGGSLSEDEATAVMEEIMTGECTDSQIAAFITAMRIKGETVEEICGFARVMREKASAVRPKSIDLIDTCGTGGDAAGTFNISTAVALVVAGCGVRVAKHGNRGVSSKCGSADVLEALGVKIDLPPDAVARCIDEAGIGFMFAPGFHQSMKHAMTPRREIAIRTVFNILGPLTNPAGASSQLLGVYDAGLTETMARVLGRLGTRHALVVHGADGLDEISTTGGSLVSELYDGRVDTYTVMPEQLGLKTAKLEDLRGGTPEQNAADIRGILSGKQGPKTDITLANTAAALVAANKAENLADGMDKAAFAIETNMAADRLERLIELTNQLGAPA